MTGPMLSPAVRAQLAQALAVLERHLGGSLLAVHLYGSALDGGLKPGSDVDLLVTVTEPLDDLTRRELCCALLAVSAPPGEHETLRALEVTVLVQAEVVPWRYPARRELQFGEWQREAIQAGHFEPAMADPDIAILLTHARQHAIALRGPAASDLFAPVPAHDLRRALADTLTIWNAPPDWDGDTGNVLLALARIWYTAVTGQIVPKDVAATWAMARLPAAQQPLMHAARAEYLGQAAGRLDAWAEEVEACVHFIRDEATRALDAHRSQ